MTKEMRKAIGTIIEEVAGEAWCGLTEEQCDAICEKCPYREQCEEEELYWGCSVWEESMGEDL